MAMQNPLVSIIVPVYNVERYLDKCLNSILKQTFHEFELILVDDGATDGSGKICDYYSKKDERIKVIHKQNGGVSSARNAGIEEAAGEYIYFCDSDDYIDETLLSSIVNLIDSKADLFMFGYNAVYENGKTLEWLPKGNDIYEICSPDDRHVFMLEMASIINFGGALWNKVFSKRIIDEYNLRFNNDLSYFEDVSFVICYSLHASKAVVIKTALYNYVRRSGQITGSLIPKNSINNVIDANKQIRAHILQSQTENADKLFRNFAALYLIRLSMNTGQTA